MLSNPRWTVSAAALAGALGCGAGRPTAAPVPPPSPPVVQSLAGWCAKLPRAANAALPVAPVTSEWFQVYQAAEGVYAFVEPSQFQEAISYLIVGTKQALMFDTGLGMVPIRPVAEQLTRLPITVINSHTHFDHVGGNAEFDRILAMDTPYTRANMAGFPHAELGTEVAPSAFCAGAPAGLDTATYHTRPWKAAAVIKDGETIDLGGRVIEVIHVPGHTPDATALLDRANGLLWTGDSYYDGQLWLYVPETDLDGYEASMARLAALAPGLKQLLPAHNTAKTGPDRLARVLAAVRQMRTGGVKGIEETGQRLIFEIDGVMILTSKALLAGKAGDRGKGGSGLTTWPPISESP